ECYVLVDAAFIDPLAARFVPFAKKECSFLSGSFFVLFDLPLVDAFERLRSSPSFPSRKTVFPLRWVPHWDQAATTPGSEQRPHQGIDGLAPADRYFGILRRTKT